MPKVAQTPVQKLTTLFMDLDGGEMEVVLSIFKALYARRTARLTPTTPSGKPMKKPVSKAKPIVEPKQLTIEEASA